MGKKIYWNDYQGPLDSAKMPLRACRAYWIFRAQLQRNTVKYTQRQFIGWWLYHLRLKVWVRPHCGRLDHSKGYSFENILMQEQADNNRERNLRRGNPAVKKPIRVFQADTGKMLRYFETQREAADFYDVDRKTVFNHATGRSRKFFKYGPGAGLNLEFRWAK